MDISNSGSFGVDHGPNLEGIPQLGQREGTREVEVDLKKSFLALKEPKPIGVVLPRALLIAAGAIGLIAVVSLSMATGLGAIGLVAAALTYLFVRHLITENPGTKRELVMGLIAFFMGAGFFVGVAIHILFSKVEGKEAMKEARKFLEFQQKEPQTEAEIILAGRNFFNELNKLMDIRFENNFFAKVMMMPNNPMVVAIETFLGKGLLEGDTSFKDFIAAREHSLSKFNENPENENAIRELANANYKIYELAREKGLL